MQCKDDDTKIAKSTTTAEFLDNLQCILQEWQRREGPDSLPLFMYDNNKIQQVADITTLRDARGQPLPLSCRLQIPTYSPDMNRPIKHMFGWLKTQMRAKMYSWVVQHPGVRHPSLKDFGEMVKAEFFKRGSPEGIAQIAADIRGLPVLWQVLQHGNGVLFQGYDKRWHKGCWGDWPPKAYR
jgi:hypothetical protein